MHYVVFQEDSFLPGYKEWTLISQKEGSVAYRVIPEFDPRLADVVSNDFLSSALEADQPRKHWRTRSRWIYNQSGWKRWCVILRVWESLRIKMKKQRTDLAILANVNLISNRNDTVWWTSIVKHNLQAKTKREAQSVREKFENVSRVDRDTAERLARLINTEEIDHILFEALAGTPDSTGKQPTCQDIQKRRQASEDGARKKMTIKLVQEDASLFEAEAKGAPQTLPGTSSISILRDPSKKGHRDEASALGRKDHSIMQAGEGAEAIEPIEDPYINAKTSTPGRITPLTAIANSISSPAREIAQEPAPDVSSPRGTTPRPIINPEQPSAADTSPNNNNVTATPIDHLEQSLTGDISPLSGQNLQQTRGTDIRHFEPTSSDNSEDRGQDQQHQNVPPPERPDHDAALDISSSKTPTQASFDAASAQAPARPAMKPRCSWQNIKWAYRTHTPADVELQGKGIWLFEKPNTWTSNPSSNGLASLQLQPDCQIIISADFEDRSEPSLDWNGTALVIHPHLPPWTHDERSFNNFAGLLPDFQSDLPLAEYQTIEALGSYVWRHDRDQLPCSGPNCKKMLSDLRPTTLVCLGCGPKSTIRFCSPECHIASLPTHAVECWSPHLLINKLIDHNTYPPRFSRLAPALRDRQGYRTYQNYRQRVAAQYAGGRYSMFNPATEEATVLIWDQRFTANRGQERPFPGYAAEMEARIERCLNVALFDHANTPVVEHLYRLLQLCLRVKNAWNPALAAVLSRQFRFEFEWDAGASLRVRADEPFCECEWAGGAVQAHQGSCSSRYRGQGELILGQRSVRDVVEAMERRYWILRAWQHQHPTVTAWTRRVMGSGFPGTVVEEGWMPKLGRGWVGFNGEEDDVVL
ncbi:MAG: hypothetical protein L6R40_008644 [Gallowayella cf. fulva]|nr:MAG: hypothetical protein L6R40_008644 [Xanthomendoza cf. fulva]